MEGDLRDQVLLLTGAGGGIGGAIAEKLSQSGMKIVLFGGNNREKLAATRELAAKYAPCLMIPGDLTDRNFLVSGLERAATEFGGIDVLINCAGMAANTPFDQVSEADFDRIMAVNVKAPFFLTQLALPHLLRSKSASIVNICSVVSHSGYPRQSTYSASKHALLGWTKSLAREYYQRGLRVHAICPGGVYTDMVKVSRPDLTADGMIMPSEIADIVHFLLTHRGNAVIDEIGVHRLNKEPFLV